MTTGPQSAALTAAALGRLRASWWRVLPHADRTGVRLAGPPLTWVRPDGGDAGLHPSNVLDNPYSVGALNISGDMPILLGPDGPSLGGFVCALTVVAGSRWKLGQMRPGDVVRFVTVHGDGADRLRRDDAARAAARVPTAVRAVRGRDVGAFVGDDVRPPAEPTPRADRRPAVRYLRGADDALLVEYDGGAGLDLHDRLRVHALASGLEAAAPQGVLDVTPGVRTLHLHVDPETLPVARLVGLLRELEEDLPPSDEIEVPSRVLRLPLSWDDPAIRDAVERYAAGVRSDAPWLPSNVDFVRRANGLASVEDVRRTVLDAEYLVVGLGDVYLGAPLAVPVDPRHRLFTTKYTPARTWTPSDAVGLGGAFLCVYGMASPGGYQLVGRTVPVWSAHAQRPPFRPGVPWLFRHFDRIVWEPVDPDELAERRAAARAGVLEVPVEDGVFSGREHAALLTREADDIAAVGAARRAAFGREAAAWAAAGRRRVRRTRDRAWPPRPDVRRRTRHRARLGRPRRPGARRAARAARRRGVARGGAAGAARRRGHARGRARGDEARAAGPGTVRRCRRRRPRGPGRPRARRRPARRRAPRRLTRRSPGAPAPSVP